MIAPSLRRPSDLPACVATLAAVHAADGYPHRWPADPARWLCPPGQLAAWVVRRGADVRGHVAITADVIKPFLAEAAQRPGSRLAAVTRLFVHPTDQRTGHARALLEQATATANDLGRRLVLDVVDDAAAALSLYQRLGWRQVGSRTATWTTPDGRHPQLLLLIAPEQ